MEKDIEQYKHYPINDGPIKVLKVQVMHGANYFSGGPIVMFRIDLCNYNEVFTNQIEGFYDKLSEWIPSLYEHFCSIGRPGGFFHRVKEGTLLGHVIEHVAIELQTLAGMDVGFGKTRSTLQEGVYNVVFRFFDDLAGVYAGKAAINLVNAILTENNFNVKEVVDSLIDIRERRLLGPSTQAIVDEAIKRKIPWIRMDQYNLVQLGTGKFQKKIRATITSDTSMLAVETADNKYLTTLMLKDAGVPVLPTIKTSKSEEIIEFFKTLNKPITIKPSEGYLGKNIHINLKSEYEILEAIKDLSTQDNTLIVQPYFAGNAYRLLVIDYKLVAAVELKPPTVVGDGVHTIAELIEIKNNEKERNIGDKGKLSKILINETTLSILDNEGVNLNTVLPINKEIQLQYSGNLRLGGSCKDITDLVHPMNRFLAERAAKIIGLNVAGVDIIANDITKSILDTNGIVLEVNAAPDFRMHYYPTEGIKRNVAVPLLNMLFPQKLQTRVPIFSVTGTVGKTMTVNILNHCLKLAGKSTGLTSSDSLFITDKLLIKGEMTFPEHMTLVLKDPTIDCAIFETSKEGILRKGLGYSAADYGIVLNMHNDHVGTDDIKYIEDLAYAKAVVAEELYDDGYAILNADNDLVYSMKSRVHAKLALFSQHAQNKHIMTHTLKGGLAVCIQDNAIMIHNKTQTSRLMYLQEIPLTFGNKAKLTYDSILASITALVAHDIPVETIRKGLSTFYPKPPLLYGRLNFVQLDSANILIDNAHNEVSFLGLKDFLSHYEKYKIGVVDAAGDRSDEEIIKLGVIAASMFNEIIFYEGVDNRGRNKGEIINLLKIGALQNNFDEKALSYYTNSTEAYLLALQKATNQNIIVILTNQYEVVDNLIKQKINQMQKE